MWQELRHAVEDMLVTQDWFELFVAQNLALDGLLYPLVYELRRRRPDGPGRHRRCRC